MIESCNDDNDVRKALFPLSESAAHCVGTDRSCASLAAKAWIDAVAPQVIEKRMPGMIEPELTAESKARDLTIQTLLITDVRESDTARSVDAQAPSPAIGLQIKSCTSRHALPGGPPERCFHRVHIMLPTQSVAADTCPRKRRDVAMMNHGVAGTEYDDACSRPLSTRHTTPPGRVFRSVDRRREAELRNNLASEFAPVRSAPAAER